MKSNDFPFKLPLLLDGATGTNLIKSGLPNDICPEEWIIKNPKPLIDLQKEFILSGSDIIYAPTFSANSEKLDGYGKKPYTVQYNIELSRISKSVSQGQALVAGCLSPTGRFVTPFGDMDFFDMFFVYLQQAEALATEVDLLVIETMSSLAEARAALLASKRQKLPTFVTITINENGRTITGASALSCLICLQELGAAAFGINCSFGPETLKPIIEEILPYAKIPIIAKPNAGQPDEDANYSLSPEKMAEEMRPLVEAGVQIIGGCCGSTPEHIKHMRKMLDSVKIGSKKPPKAEVDLVLSNEKDVFFLVPHQTEISEYIRCSSDMADELLELSESPVDIIAVDLISYDDAIIFAENAYMSQLPIMFRSDSKLALETALILYNGRAAIDKSSSISEIDLEELVKKYGAILY